MNMGNNSTDGKTQQTLLEALAVDFSNTKFFLKNSYVNTGW